MDLARLLRILQRLWKSNRFVRFGIIMTIGLLFRNVIYMRIYRKLNKLPHGPNGIPILGVLLYGWSIGTVEYHAYVLPKYGAIVSYPTVMQQVMLINDPEIARKIYSNQDGLNRFEPFLDESVSNTITFLNGDKWWQRRKNIHSNLISTINSNEITKGSVTFLQNVLFPYLDRRKMINNTRLILRPLTFNLVFYACVGKNIQSLNDEFFIKFDNLATKFWSNFRKRMFTSFLIGNGKLYKYLFKPIFNLGELGENIRKDMVKLVIEYNNNNNINNNNNNGDRKCFVDYMRETKTLTEEEIFADVTSLLFPSIDTTSNVLGFCIFLLCKYPQKVQEFIYEKELKPVFGSVDNICLSQNILCQLPYFRAFIFETMRIYPAVPVSAPHYLDNHDMDNKPESIIIDIDNNGKTERYEINENLKFSINSIGIGRNPKHWIKNNKLTNSTNIDREYMMNIHFEFWLDEYGAFKPNKSLTLFSLGRRECVGKQVAINNIYVVLAALMLRYRFSVKNHKTFKIPSKNNPLYAPGIADIFIMRRDDKEEKEYDDDDDDDEEEEEEYHIPISQSNLVIANAGFDAINGDYRWFLHCSKWCLFKEDVSYSMENGIDTEDVYIQLNKLQAGNANFKWNKSIKKCWIISSMDGSAIYYAAPQINNEYIPNKKNEWISVHGSLPGPNIFPNLLESSFAPDDNEQFGNVIPDVYRRSTSSLSSLQPVIESDHNYNNDDNDDNDDNGVLIVQEDDDDDDESLSDLN